MLRTLVFVPVAAFALGAPVAAARDFPRAIVGTEVHADDGTVIGHVTAVTRDRAGNITSVAIPGLEPPDASSLRGPVVAENNIDGRHMRVIDMRARPHVWINQTSARERARLH